MRACRQARALGAVLAATAGSARAVEVTRAPDGSVAVVASAYEAAFDRTGRPTSLRIGGVEFLDPAGGEFPCAGSGAVVRVEGATVATSRGGARASFAFDDRGFAVEQEGGSIAYLLSTGVTAVVQRDGQASDRTVGDVVKVVAGPAAFAVSEPFHWIHRKFLPSRLCGRGGDPKDLFRYRVDCGVAVAPPELLALGEPACGDTPAGHTPELGAGEPARVRLPLRNLGATAVEATVRFRALDHCVDGRTVAERAVVLAVPAGTSAVAAAELPLPGPGLYWVKADVLTGERRWKGTELGVISEPAKYRPALTRPDDFAEFWAGQLAAMRRIPFDARLTAAPDRSDERFEHFDLELADHRGRPMKTFLRVPRAPGPHDAEVHSYWGSTAQDKVLDGLLKLEKQPAGAGMRERGGNRIRAGAPQPEDGTYRRWEGREDNNCLDSYLLNVRVADYLRSRADVKLLWLFGASRSGASMLAAAALSPERVAAVNVHVPTCGGLSWADKPYRGWGSPPSPTPEGLRIASYFDPVNFAPDLAVPLVMDGGFYDGLAPAPGILAFHNWADRAPFRRCAIELGHHGYFKVSRRKEMEAALAAFLAGHTGGQPGE